jgi:CRISPR-associated endonuclease/helicase Cas3
MPEGTLHLSALMCGAHRKDVIAHIKERLKAKREGRDTRPLRVVSTQLVEAGVDIDFPVVYRALAGLDSIAQAAGRCNREGRMEGKGRVVVFVPPERPPKGHLEQAAQSLVRTLPSANLDPLNRALFDAYFRDFYHAVSLDQHNVVNLLKVQPHELAVKFQSAAKVFKLVEDEASVVVVVRYPQAEDDIDTLLHRLAVQGPERWLMRKLQRYTVNIREKVALRMLEEGSLGASVVPGMYLQVDAAGLYDPCLGLHLEGIPIDALGYVY